jgi:hypothetical protein
MGDVVWRVGVSAFVLDLCFKVVESDKLSLIEHGVVQSFNPTADSQILGTI